MARISRSARQERPGHWWRASKTDVGEKVLSTCRAIRTHQQSRISDILEAHELYGARAETLYGFTHVTTRDNREPLPINIISQVCDGFTSRVAATKPRIMHVSVGGDYSLQRKAQERTEFVDGVWYANQMRTLARMCALEAAVSGTGVIKATALDDVVLEAVPPEELWVDDVDARYGRPRNLFHRTYWDRTQLIEMFSSYGAEIDEAGDGDADDLEYPGHDPQADQLLVTEAWHLRSSPDSDDGRHVIAIEGATLIDEPWELDRFPFSFLRFRPPLRGFWGRSVLDDVYGIQMAINALMTQILTSLRELGKAHVMLERGSKVNPAQFTDAHEVDFIEYTGRPPQIVTVQVVPPEVYELVWQLVSRAFQQVGLSEMSAQAKLPARFESGEAIRMYEDVQSGRYVHPSQEYQDWHVDSAKLCLATAGQLAKRKGGYSALYVGRRYGKEIAKRIDYWEPEEGEEYVLRPHPVSGLTGEPSHDIDLIIRYKQAGELTPMEAMSLLELPDLDGVVARKTAGVQVVERFIERMLEEGKYEPPWPELPLAYARERAEQAILLAHLDEAPEERIGLVRQWLDEVIFLEEDSQPAPPPGAEQQIPPGQPPVATPPEMPS